MPLDLSYSSSRPASEKPCDRETRAGAGLQREYRGVAPIRPRTPLPDRMPFKREGADRTDRHLARLPSSTRTTSGQEHLTRLCG